VCDVQGRVVLNLADALSDGGNHAHGR
jgi:hypothetical protein